MEAHWKGTIPGISRRHYRPRRAAEPHPWRPGREIRNAVRRRRAKLLIFHAHKSDLDQHADICANIVSLEHVFWDRVTEALKDVKRPALVYGAAAMTPIGVTVMSRLIQILESNPSRHAPCWSAANGTNSLAVAAAASNHRRCRTMARHQSLQYCISSRATNPMGARGCSRRSLCVRCLSRLTACGAGELPVELTEAARIVYQQQRGARSPHGHEHRRTRIGAAHGVAAARRGA